MSVSFIEYVSDKASEEARHLTTLLQKFHLDTSPDWVVGQFIKDIYEKAMNRREIAGMGGNPHIPNWVGIGQNLHTYRERWAQRVSTDEILEIDLQPPGDQLFGTIGKVFLQSGLANRAFPNFAFGPEEQQKFMESLFVEMASKNPLFNLPDIADAAEKFSKISQIFDGLNVSDKEAMAKIVLNFASWYFGLDYEKWRSDKVVSTPQIFSFDDFKYDHFIHAALQKGHLTPEMTLNEITQGINDGAYVFTFQGNQLLQVFNQLFESNISLGEIFERIRNLGIVPKKLRRKPMLVGDGLSGSLGTEFITSEASRNFKMVITESTLDEVRVSAALRFLTFLARDLLQEDGDVKGNLLRRFLASSADKPDAIIRASDVFMAAAVLNAPLGYAQSVNNAILSGTYYVRPLEEPLDFQLLLGGYLVSKVLQRKLDGVFYPARRSATPTTASVPDSTPSAAFARWIRELVKLDEASRYISTLEFDSSLRGVPYAPSPVTFSGFSTSSTPSRIRSRGPSVMARFLEQLSLKMARVSSRFGGPSTGWQIRKIYFDRLAAMMGFQMTPMVSLLAVGSLGHILRYYLSLKLLDIQNLNLSHLHINGGTFAPNQDFTQRLQTAAKIPALQKDDQGRIINGHFAEAKLRAFQTGNEHPVNEVEVRFFVSAQTAETRSLGQPAVLKESSNRITRNLTVVSNELLERYRRLAKVPIQANPDLILRFATSSQIETYLSYIFSGHAVNELNLKFHVPLIAGHDYLLQIQPKSREQPSFVFQLVDPGLKAGESDFVVIEGNFEVGKIIPSTKSASQERQASLSQHSAPAFSADADMKRVLTRGAQLRWGEFSNPAIRSFSRAYK